MSTKGFLGQSGLLVLLGCAIGLGCAPRTVGAPLPQLASEFGPNFFQDRVVTIAVTRDGKITVQPEVAVIFYDPLLRDPRRPRQVRWVVECPYGEYDQQRTPARCLENNEVLTIRPKRGQSQTLFTNPQLEGRAEFPVPGRYNAIASGLPNKPDFSRNKEIVWRYEIELRRDGEVVAKYDPEVRIHQDG